MSMSNFSQHDLEGRNSWYREAVERIRDTYGFDFVAIGLTAFPGAPLKWIYGAGATNERYRRIVLAPGHGIGGIVIKSGKPMMFLDIDEQIDPREYSSYPIVFAEDLRSFCALPLLKEGRVVGSLLCAYRSTSSIHERRYRTLIDALEGTLCDLEVTTTDFMYFDESRTAVGRTPSAALLPRSALSQAIEAQEAERKRISRELHDSIAQELLSASFQVRQIQIAIEDEHVRDLLTQLNGKIETILDELHNISVELRPSALDHLGLIAALKSQALVIEKTYGTRILFKGGLSKKRFNHTHETQVYRICQEAILNACKYSGSDIVLVSLEDVDNWLYAKIEDTGHGFDTDNPPIKGSGCGLSGIQERANLIGATLTIESGDSGTTVTLVAPMGAYDRGQDDPDSSCR